MRYTQFLKMLVTPVALVRLLAKPHWDQHSLWAFNMSPFNFKPLINNIKVFHLLVWFILLFCLEYKIFKCLDKVFKLHNNNKVVYKVVLPILGLSNRPYLLYLACLVVYINNSSILINLGLLPLTWCMLILQCTHKNWVNWNNTANCNQICCEVLQHILVAPI